MLLANASLLLVLLCLLQIPARAAPGEVIERGKFRLYAWSSAWGEETYRISAEAGALALRSSVSFGVGGMAAAPLQATLRLQEDLTPTRFQVKGATFAGPPKDVSVDVADLAAVPERFFTISGDAPASVQMMLLRYCKRHKMQGPLATLPEGEVTVEYRGADTVRLGNRQVRLDRYSVGGIVWGHETLWTDASMRLVAAVYCRDTYVLLQVIREGFEPARGFFLTKAAEDGVERLARLAQPFDSSPPRPVAILGGLLIDGTGKPSVPDSAVLIRGDRIVAAGSRSEVRVPEGAFIVDAAGKAVLPGLWDMHAHLRQVEWGPVYLAAGVTTVRDVLNEFEFAVALRDAFNAGRGPGPSILLAGVIDGHDPRAVGVRAGNAAEARALVRRYKAAGYQQIKVYNLVSRDVLAAITAEARRLGMTVTGHVPHGLSALEAVKSGMGQIEHLYFLAPLMRPGGGVLQSLLDDAAGIELESEQAREAIRFLKQQGTVIVPTLSLVELTYRTAGSPVETFEPGIAKLPSGLANACRARGWVAEQDTPLARTAVANLLALAGALHKAGIPVVAGTDRSVPGHSVHREIELLVKAGLTPMEAIQAATSLPARVMKLDRETGTLESGKRADLILVEGNPLDSISEIRNVRLIFAQGKMYDCGQLWRSVGFMP